MKNTGTSASTPISNMNNASLTSMKTISLIAIFLLATLTAAAQQPAGHQTTDTTKTAAAQQPLNRTKIDSIKITATDTSTRQPFNQKLQEVTVTGVKSPITYKADKTILSVKGNPIATGSNAWDVLVKAPGIIEQNANIKLRGKGGNVLIDGRPMYLSGEDLKNLLSSMPTNGIDRIELIHAPSARYDAQGGAVINIILSKNQKYGTNGTATLGAGAGTYGLYNAGINLNHREKKFNVAGALDHQHHESYSTQHFLRTTANTATVGDDRYQVERRNSFSLRTNIDYDINKNQTIGLTVKGLLSEKNKRGDTRSEAGRVGYDMDSLSTVATHGKTNTFIPSVNLYYKVKLDTNGKQLTINADYFAFSKSLHDEYQTRYYDAKGIEHAAPYGLKATAPAMNDIISMTADYVQPVKKGSLEAGLKWSEATTDNDARWEQNTVGTWNTDAGKTNHFIYKESIYAGYFNASRSIGKVELGLGVRAEQTFTTGYSVTLQQTNKDQYLNLFPNVSIGYQASSAHQFSFNYRKSIERYKYDIVNPFIVYKSQYAWYQGNPHLSPGMSHNFSLSHIWKGSLMTAISYSRFENVLADIYRKDSASQAVISTWGTFNSADYYELMVSYGKSFFNNKWISNNSVTMMSAGYNAPASANLYKANFAASISTDNVIVLSKGWKWQLSGSWYSPLSLGIVNTRSRFSMNTGIVKMVAQGKGTFTLNVSDIFNTERSRYKVSSYDIKTDNRDKYESRFVRLTFAYRFGNNKVKAAANRRTGIETETRRMQ